MFVEVGPDNQHLFYENVETLIAFLMGNSNQSEEENHVTVSEDMWLN